MSYQICAVGGAKVVIVSYWLAAILPEHAMQHPSPPPTPPSTPPHIKVTGMPVFTRCSNLNSVTQSMERC